jgi:hypothetical protein
MSEGDVGVRVDVWEDTAQQGVICVGEGVIISMDETTYTVKMEGGEEKEIQRSAYKNGFGGLRRIDVKPPQWIKGGGKSTSRKSTRRKSTRRKSTRRKSTRRKSTKKFKKKSKKKSKKQSK